MVSTSQTSTTHQGEGYVWRPRPLNVWVAMEAHYALQAYVLEELQNRLEEMGSIFLEDPRQATVNGPVPHLGVGFGLTLEDEHSVFDVYGKMPKPRGSALYISAVPELPHQKLFDMARGQLVRKACHLAIIVEGDLESRHIKRAVWGSMAGNNRLIEGTQAEILDNLALRVLAHAGAEKVNVFAGADTERLDWDDWVQSELHKDISDAAHALGAKGIIENEVSLIEYSSGAHARTLLKFLERAALGEGMRSQLDLKRRIMGVTTTGGDKINVSPDPIAGQVVPISQLTWQGYIEATPKGCPITYPAPSIETQENGFVFLAGALIDAGLVHDLDEFLTYLKDHFSREERIDIMPEGLAPKCTAIDHFHRQPSPESIDDPEMVEIVYPDFNRFPEIDFPCGVREGGLQLLSAVFQSKTFMTPGPLQKLVVVILPGHGSVAIYNGPRAELTDWLVNRMEMEEVTRV